MTPRPYISNAHLAHQLERLLAQGVHMAATVAQIQAEIAELKEKVAKTTDVVASAKTLFQGLSALIASLKQQLLDAIAAGGDPAKLQEIVDGLNETEATLDAKNQELADAIVANTPAE